MEERRVRRKKGYYSVHIFLNHHLFYRSFEDGYTQGGREKPDAAATVTAAIIICIAMARGKRGVQRGERATGST